MFDISENLVQVKDEPLGKPSAEDIQALREDTSGRLRTDTRRSCRRSSGTDRGAS